MEGLRACLYTTTQHVEGQEECSPGTGSRHDMCHNLFWGGRQTCTGGGRGMMSGATRRTPTEMEHHFPITFVHFYKNVSLDRA